MKKYARPQALKTKPSSNTTVSGFSCCWRLASISVRFRCSSERPGDICHSAALSPIVNREDVPWATALLAVWMVGLYLFDPALDTTAEYFFLSPWMHSGWSHFWNNMAFFIPLGIYAERRVESLPFLVFSVLIPYLALHVPPLWGLGGWSQGASGLTKALTAYAIPVLLVDFSGRLEEFSDFEFEWKEVAVAIVVLLAVVFLTNGAWETVERFAGLEPSPDGVSVGSHLFGLVLGVLWFGWRSWRHGLENL